MEFKDEELLYAATSKCTCGAGLAYPLDHQQAMNIAAWICSRVLRGEVQPEHLRNHSAYSFSMYKIREETSIRNTHGSTRPAGTIARTIGKATCPRCAHEWQSEPYNANGASSHWNPGPCPKCAYAVGATGIYSSNDGEPIKTSYLDVVLKSEDPALRA